MKRILSILITFALCTASYAQSYKMVDTSTPMVNEINQSITPKNQYDSLSNICPHFDLDYYKQFIGQSILFYPRNPNSKSLPEYFANFTTPKYQVIAIDTVWRKRRENPKPKDYKLEEIISNRYRPLYVKNKGVTLCGDNDIVVDKGQSFYPYSKIRSDNTLAIHSGSFTPYYEIEDKTFKILDIRHATDASFFTLQSENGDTLYWNTDRAEYDKASHQNQQYPVIVVGFIEKMKQTYLGKDFYVSNFQPMEKYKCCDVVYSGEEGEYMVPSFLLKNEQEDEDKNKIIPLSNTPSLFSCETDSYEKFSKINRTTLRELGVMPAKEYEEYKVQRENERIAKAEKERIEKANAEKEHALVIQKRTQYLNKKYGARIGKMILNGEVQIGMTREMCKESWGSPQKINTTTTTQTVSEQWVYGGHSYLYFTNGRLTAIQN